MSAAETRAALGLTAEQLAELLACSVRTVWRLEEPGHRPPGSTGLLLQWLADAAESRLLSPDWNTGDLSDRWRRILIAATATELRRIGRDR